ncbi:MAG: flagellar protein FlgN [Syntrophomonadaceae bacterium]|nr:flagellar protein FlgN [Syntrophomonadaceae bacterium]
MDELFASLIKLLEDQEELMARLVLLGEREMTALKKNDLPWLCSLVSEQEKTSQALSRLEEERVRLQSELSAALHPGSNMILRDFLPFAGKDQARLEILSASLQAHCLRLQDLNETNTLLIRQSLAYINRLMPHFAPNEGATYSPEGHLQPLSKAVVLNKTV